MKPLKRKPINKNSSAKQFKRNVSKTKVVNIKKPLMRGGERL